MNNIILIEDESMIADMYRFQFQKMGCEIAVFTQATKGLEALKVDSTKYDLLLLDMMMPDIDGITLLKQLRTHEQDHHISPPLPVIILSNLGDEYAYKQISEQDILGYLVKARYTPKQIFEEVQKLYQAHLDTQPAP
jgi:CheY-like chemotaxis protein